MARVTGAGGVVREMRLDVVEAQQQAPVERDPQRVQRGQQRARGIATGRIVEPQRAVAAQPGELPAVGAAGGGGVQAASAGVRAGFVGGATQHRMRGVERQHGPVTRVQRRGQRVGRGVVQQCVGPVAHAGYDTGRLSIRG